MFSGPTSRLSWRSASTKGSPLHVADRAADLDDLDLRAKRLFLA